jgi:hypothetical protein
MAIRPQILAGGSKMTAATESTIYTHKNNTDVQKPPTSDLELKNNQDALDLMVDPEEGKPGTHKGAHTVYTHDGNTDPQGGGKVAKIDASATVKANEGGSGPTTALPNDEDPAKGYVKEHGGDSGKEVKANDAGSGPTTALPNNVDPAAGVVKETLESPVTEVSSTEPEVLVVENAPANPIEVSSEAENDWVAGNPMQQAPMGPEGEPGLAPHVGEACSAPANGGGAGSGVNGIAPVGENIQTPEIPAQQPQPIAPVAAQPPMQEPTIAPLPVSTPGGIGGVEDPMAGEDVMSILDADDIDDGDTEDLAFAQMGASVLVLRKDRVIASMTEANAVEAGVNQVYTSSEFQDAALAECKRYGLRAGLESMGYQLAEVNIGRSEVINARVRSHVERATASARDELKLQSDGFAQCLAIATVGINRNFWQDVPNELRAALEHQLTAAGLRNAGNVVRQVFAQHGTGYAKAILAMAEKLAAMSETTRNELARALDMVNASGKMEPKEEDDHEEGEGEDCEAFATPASVTAALSFAGTRTKGVLLTPKQSAYSVTAAAFLNSDELLF